ncbi:MAG TPA: methyltransferase domain-containing protein [Actinomycetota bacterium]|nr:methyltransferase domain-containing protein [Actinomycetota bacterium]
MPPNLPSQAEGRSSLDRSMEPYYDRRAAEYDEWYAGNGLFAARERPGWDEDVRTLLDVIASLAPVRTVDVACGTGFLTRALHGDVVGVDASLAMLATARARHRIAAVRADGFTLPFRDRAFDRVFTGHFYGHLYPEQRARFLDEARRVAPALLVVDAKLHSAVEPEQIQERILNDGSRHEVFKRYFTADQLVAELGGGDVLMDGRWFVAVERRR